MHEKNDGSTGPDSGDVELDIAVNTVGARALEAERMATLDTLNTELDNAFNKPADEKLDPAALNEALRKYRTVFEFVGSNSDAFKPNSATE